VLTYGGIVHSLEVPDASGQVVNVVLGFASIDGYLAAGDAYFGGLVGRFANRLAVTGNGLFGLCNGSILVTQHIRPEPAVQCFLIGLQNALAQAKAGVKKNLIAFVGSIKILYQAH